MIHQYDSSGRGEGEHNIKHPTVKPIELMEYLLLLCSNQDDVIIDPFVGSGTTGIACRNLGRHFIGIEKERKYYELAKARINGEPIPANDDSNDDSQHSNEREQLGQLRLF